MEKKEKTKNDYYNHHQIEKIVPTGMSHSFQLLTPSMKVSISYISFMASLQCFNILFILLLSRCYGRHSKRMQGKKSECDVLHSIFHRQVAWHKLPDCNTLWHYTHRNEWILSYNGNLINIENENKSNLDRERE